MNKKITCKKLRKMNGKNIQIKKNKNLNINIKENKDQIKLNIIGIEEKLLRVLLFHKHQKNKSQNQIKINFQINLMD